MYNNKHLIIDSWPPLNIATKDLKTAVSSLVQAWQKYP